MRSASLLLLFLACRPQEQTWPMDQRLPSADLAPVPPGAGPGDPLFGAQIPRERPYALALSADGARAFVTLRGKDSAPGHELAVVDTAAMQATGRIPVGSSPNDVALHPGGRFLVVAHRYSPFLSVVDVEREVEVDRFPVPYYGTQLSFRADGRRLYLTNRWLDSVQVFEVEVREDRLELRLREPGASRVGDRLAGMAGVPVGANPRGIALDEQRGRAFVGNLPDLTVSVIDLEAEVELDGDRDPRTEDPGAPPGVTRLFVGAPVSDVLVIGRTLFVATLQAGTGNPGSEGPDREGDGQPGDGSPGVFFSDVENEIATFDTESLRPGPRYTSDSIIGFFDDPPEGAAGLPDPGLRLVRGALPERLISLRRGEEELLGVVMAGSGELGLYRVQGPALSFSSTLAAGLFPYAAAVHPDGESVFVVSRLEDALLRVDLSNGTVRRAALGPADAPPFPASDAEIGELFNDMTAAFTADGDQTCEHCHREGNAIRKTHGMPLRKSKLAAINIPAHRNLRATRPLFFENIIDENTVFPPFNEMCRSENFSPGGALAHHGSRDAFMLEQAARWFGRRESFGDATGAPVPLDFRGVAKMLMVFLLADARLLPNPNPPQAYSVERGRALFMSPATNCSGCHPPPEYALTEAHAQAGIPLTMRVLSPEQWEGANLDQLSGPFKQRFPSAQDDRFGVPSLRGLWDRPEIFFHDGRARSLIEALAPPGHPILRPGERGFNERDGIPDLHGGTSHLSPDELRDLKSFLLSIE